MGAVFLAYDEQQEHSTRVPLAVKVVPQASSEEARQQLRELFEREASAAAMLAQAPHFVRVLAHDVGVDPAFLVMEHVDWPTLRDCIRQAREDGRGQGLSPAMVARIGIAVLRGVSVMHYHRVVHRDLKPSNIFFRRNENDDFDIKILDFGVWTREATEDGPHDSVVGLGHRLDQVPVGTYSYMSPEQMAGRPVTARSDLHTLGSVLWELVTGTVPYRMNNALQGRALSDRFERLKSLPVKPENMSDGFYGVLARALAFEPKERWDSAEEMKLALKVWLAEEVMRSKSAFTGCAGRIETLDAQVEHVKAQLSPARDLLHQVDQLSGLVYLLKSQAEDASPDAISGAVEEMEIRVDALAKELSVFSRDVMESSQRISREKTEDLGGSLDLPALRDPANQRVAAFVGPIAPRLVLLASVVSALIAAVAFTVVLARRRPVDPPPSQASKLAAVAPSVAPRSEQPPRTEPQGPIRISPAGHTRGPILVGFELNGVLSAGRDGSVLWLEPKTGGVERLHNLSSGVTSLAVSPNARLAALGLADGRLIMLETSSGRRLLERPTESGPLTLVRFSPNGRHVVFPGDGESLSVLRSDSLELRSLGASSSRRRGSSGAPSTTRDLGFSEDGRTLYVLGKRGTVRVFDLESGRSLRKPIELASPHADQLAVAGDGKRLVYTDGRGALHTHMLDGRAQVTEALRSGGERTTGFVVVGDTLYATRLSGGIEAIDLSKKLPPAVIAPEIGPAVSLAIDRARDRLVVAGRDRRVHVLSAKKRGLERTFAAGPRALSAVAAAPDGRGLALAEADTGLVRIVEPEALRSMRILDGPTSGLQALAYLSDGRLIGGDENGLLWLWPTKEDTASRLGPPEANGITALAADPKQARVFLARGRQDVEQIDVDTGRVLRRLDTGRASVTALAVSRDGALLGVASDDGHVTLYETEKGRRIHDVRASRHTLRAIEFAPDGRSFASTGDEGTVLIHRTDTGTLLRTHRDDGVRAFQLAFSADGLRLISGRADGSLTILEATGPMRLAHITAHAGPVVGLVAQADGKLASVGLDGLLRTHGAQGEPVFAGGGSARDWIGLSHSQRPVCEAPVCSMFSVTATD